MARRTKGRTRSDRRRATLVRAGLIQAGDPAGRSSAIAGVIARRGKSLEVEPLFQPGPPLPIERAAVKPNPGDLVLFTFSLGLRARIIRSLGKSGVLKDVMEALLADSGIRRGFAQAVTADAAKAASLHDVSDADRVDLRRLFTFTIDPELAQDFDDALSFIRGAGGVTTVYVHIADVSYYVLEGTALDREALRRGTSVYVATGVEPMLPPLLSSGVCSLRPDEDRKTVTVEMEIESGGKVLGSRFYRSLIRSDLRLDYEQVERMIQGLEPIDPAFEAPLSWGRELAHTLRDVRRRRGSLQVESVEPEFEWDEDGEVVSADPGEELESHWFIENFMVLANEQVASYLEKERVPTVYRVHDLPDPFRVGNLLAVLSSLGVPTPRFDPLTATSEDIRRVMREMGGLIETHAAEGLGRAALTQQVLRAQSRAVYDTGNIGHFGLASSTYCHFTSPIRRYPDLLVHRALLGRLGLMPEPAAAFLADWAEQCSKTEREAAKIELKADDIVLAHLLRRRLDEEGWKSVFDGQVLSLTRRGMFVLFDRLFQGYLSVSELPRDEYRLNELETALEGKRTSRSYKLADQVQIRVMAVDAVRGRVDLTLASGAGRDGDERAGGRQGASGSGGAPRRGRR